MTLKLELPSAALFPDRHAPAGRQATLLTFDGKHYRPLPELEIEEPHSRSRSESSP